LRDHFKRRAGRAEAAQQGIIPASDDPQMW
jgi:hypothetical protein